MNARVALILVGFGCGALGWADDFCKKSPAQWREILLGAYPLMVRAMGAGPSYSPNRKVAESINETFRCDPTKMSKEARQCIEPTIRLLRYLALTGRLQNPNLGDLKIGFNEVFPKGWDGPSHIGISSDEVRAATRTYFPGPWTLGFGKGDKEYLESTARFTEVPNFLREPEFLDNLKSVEALPKAEAYLATLNESRKKAGQDPILFSTYTPVAPDNLTLRMTMYVPGEPARWLGITIGKDPTFSVIGVESRGKGEEAKLHTYFRDHKKTESKGHVSLFSPDAAVFPTSCRDCHKSGPLMPHAKAGSVRKAGADDYEKMRKIMKGYPPTEYGDDPGPPNPVAGFGDPKDKSKVRPLLKRCVENALNPRDKTYSEYYSGEKLQDELVSDSLKKMEGAYNCTGCHDGVSRGALVPPMGASFARYLESGLMPPHNKLSKAERKLLADCAEDIFLSTMDKQVPILLQKLKAGCPEDAPIDDKPAKDTPPEKSGENPEHQERERD